MWSVEECRCEERQERMGERLDDNIILLRQDEEK